MFAHRLAIFWLVGTTGALARIIVIDGGLRLPKHDRACQKLD